MKIQEIKKEMLEFEDFYGSDLIVMSQIKSAKSKIELKEIIRCHKRRMEDSLLDAISHLEEFEKRLGLDQL